MKLEISVQKIVISQVAPNSLQHKTFTLFLQGMCSYAYIKDCSNFSIKAKGEPITAVCQLIWKIPPLFTMVSKIIMFSYRLNLLEMYQVSCRVQSIFYVLYFTHILVSGEQKRLWSGKEWFPSQPITDSLWWS